MFGDRPIFGNAEYKIDSKGRLYIPKFSYVEPDDELIIQKGEDNYYVIINWSKIKKEIEQLEKENKKDKIELITHSIVSLVKVDKMRRIIFQPHESFTIDRTVFMHGNYDSIQIFPSKKDYEEHIERLKKNL